MNVLDETGFSTYLNRDTSEDPEVQRVQPEQEETPPAETGTRPSDSGMDEQGEGPTEEPDPVEINVKPADEETNIPEEADAPLIEKRLRKSVIYFVEVDQNGSIGLKKIVRPVYYEDSPLTETLKSLIEGLGTEELNQGLISLIPKETRLRRVWIKDGVAYIDFSEALRFNQFGTEGLKAELQQIVFTATEFQTVDSVQILINGEKIDYLSSEGIYVGQPLSRQDVM